MRIAGTSPSGKGSVNQAHVNDEGELSVRATTEEEPIHRVREGEGYTIYTGRITLTTDTFRPVLYIKNNDVEDLVFTTLVVGASPSTGGANDGVLIEQLGNIAVTDDIVQTGTDLIAFNRNSGVNRPFVGDIKLKSDATPSGNEVKGNGVLSDFRGGSPISLTSIIAKGQSVAIGVTPPSGNTSQDVTVSLAFHLEESL